MLLVNSPDLLGEPAHSQRHGFGLGLGSRGKHLFVGGDVPDQRKGVDLGIGAQAGSVRHVVGMADRRHDGVGGSLGAAAHPPPGMRSEHVRVGCGQPLVANRSHPAEDGAGFFGGDVHGARDQVAPIRDGAADGAGHAGESDRLADWGGDEQVYERAGFGAEGLGDVHGGPFFEGR